VAAAIALFPGHAQPSSLFQACTSLKSAYSYKSPLGIAQAIGICNSVVQCTFKLKGFRLRGMLAQVNETNNFPKKSAIKR